MIQRRRDAGVVQAPAAFFAVASEGGPPRANRAYSVLRFGAARPVAELEVDIGQAPPTLLELPPGLAIPIPVEGPHSIHGIAHPDCQPLLRHQSPRQLSSRELTGGQSGLRVAGPAAG